MSLAEQSYERDRKEAREAYNRGDYALALSGYESCRSYIENRMVNVSKEGAWHINYWVAVCRTAVGEYYEALRSFIKLFEEYEEVKPVISQWDYPYDYFLYYNAAKTYSMINQWLNTQEMLELAIKTDYASKNKIRYMTAIWFLGDVHREKGEFEQAWKYYEETKRYYEKEDPLKLFQLNTDIAELYSKQGEKENALTLLKENLNKNSALEKPDSYIETRTVDVITELIIEMLSDNSVDNPEELFSYAESLILAQLENLDKQEKEKKEKEGEGEEDEEDLTDRVKWLACLSKLSSLVGDKKVFSRTEKLVEDFKLDDASGANLDYWKDAAQIYQ
ncbi:MAG: tetratricopeptide repeat protein, partial [Candidatus Odinarchaeota archaeon]